MEINDSNLMVAGNQSSRSPDGSFRIIVTQYVISSRLLISDAII